MYLGKTLFAQVMDFLPWKTFHRIVNRYGGDHRTRSLPRNSTGADADLAIMRRL
jgi:Domain of unknown function (DUF4372)